MKAADVPSGSARVVETGFVYQEVYNGSGGTTLYLPMFTSIRVSAGADVTVTVGGVLAMTLRSGEVERINVGGGQKDRSNTQPGKGSSTVTVVIGAGDARVQIATMTDPGRRDVSGDVREA